MNFFVILGWEHMVKKHLNQNNLEALLTEERLVKLWWKPGPKIDGTYSKKWKDWKNAMVRGGLASGSAGD